MANTLKITGYVGGESSDVRELLRSEPSRFLPVPATCDHEGFEVHSPGSPLDGATVSASQVGGEGTRLTKLTVRVRDPFAGSARKHQYLEASRLVGTVSQRLGDTLKRAS